MARTLAITIVVAGLAGGLLGWGVFAPGTAPTLLPFPGEAGEATEGAGEGGPSPADRMPVADDRHVFPLLPADVASTREAPSLAVAPDGSVVLAWASETGPDERTIFLARSTDGGATFGEPIPWRVVPTYSWTVEHDGRTMSHSTHVLPRLASGGGGLALGWVEAKPGGPSATFLAARSADGGVSFGAPVALSGPDAPRPGFTALEVSPEGDIFASWIDNRDGAQRPYSSRWPAGADGPDPDRLVFAGPEGLGICPCCDTAAIVPGAGEAIVAFRNGDGGHRDIWLARATGDGAFGAPIQVAPERAWAFQGCPHDGPTLALAGDRLVVAWMDGSSGTDRVAIAEADAANLAFSASRELDPEATGAQGHPRLAAAPDGRVFAAWEATIDASDGGAEGGRAIRFALARDRDGSVGQALFLAPRPGAYQTHPILAIGPDGVVHVAWNELDEHGKRIVVVRHRPGPSPSDVAGH